MYSRNKLITLTINENSIQRYIHTYMDVETNTYVCTLKKPIKIKL